MALPDKFYDWNTIKGLLDRHMTFSYNYDTHKNWYIIEVNTGREIAKCLLCSPLSNAHKVPVWNDAAFTEFEASYKVLGNLPPANISPEGFPIVVTAAEKHSPLSGASVGPIELIAPPNSIAITDFKVVQDLEIRGGNFSASATTKGDYVTVELVDKDDVLGLFSKYGVPAGGILSLAKPVEKVPMLTRNTVWSRMEEMDTDEKLVAGLYVRFKYENNSASTTVHACGDIKVRR